MPSCSYELSLLPKENMHRVIIHINAFADQTPKAIMGISRVGNSKEEGKGN